MTRTEVYDLINAERDRQDIKWGKQNSLHNSALLAILMEEVGEVAKEMLDRRVDAVSALHGVSHVIRDELVQVAAVAVVWLESLGCPLADVSDWNKA